MHNYTNDYLNICGCTIQFLKDLMYILMYLPTNPKKKNEKSLKIFYLQIALKDISITGTDYSIDAV